MVSISTPTFDLDGALISPNGTATNKNHSRRATRVPVLDLAVGAVLVDGGYSAGDQTYSVQMPDKTGALYATLIRMIGLYSSAVMSCNAGCFLVLLSGVASLNGVTTCTAEVLGELS